MSVSLTSDIMIEIFSYLPQNEIETTYCRVCRVCKEWKGFTHELHFWQKIATLTSVDLRPNDTVETISSRIKRHIVISEDGKLKEKFKSFFSNVPEGETRVLYYRSTRRSDAFGFYIKTTNADVFKELGQLGSQRDEALKDLTEKMKGLMITGQGEADHAVDGHFFACLHNRGLFVSSTNINDNMKWSWCKVVTYGLPE